MIKAQRAELGAEPGAVPLGSALAPTELVAGLGAQQGSELLSLLGSQSHCAAFSKQQDSSSEAALCEQR